MVCPTNPLTFDNYHPDLFPIASHDKPTSIYYSSDSPPAVIIAVNTFADDIQRVTGTRPPVCSSDEPINSGARAIFVGTVKSSLIQGARHDFREEGAADTSKSMKMGDDWTDLEGRWEVWDIRIIPKSQLSQDRLIITGSDRVRPFSIPS
jgi:hypothetical protein